MTGRERAREGVDGMLARGVRAALVAYAKALASALDSGVPDATLVSHGIPWPDIQQAHRAVSGVVLVGEDGHRFRNGAGVCAVCGDDAADHEPESATAREQTP